MLAIWPGISGQIVYLPGQIMYHPGQIVYHPGRTFYHIGLIIYLRTSSPWPDYVLLLLGRLFTSLARLFTTLSRLFTSNIEVNNLAKKS